jgi:hypothetical protein
MNILDYQQLLATATAAEDKARRTNNPEDWVAAAYHFGGLGDDVNSVYCLQQAEILAGCRK